jgi:site-specific DNA-cytosine methylase
MKTSLELFSGSQAVSYVATIKGYDAWSVDNDPTTSPRLCADILKLDYAKLPDKFNFIWASPDCRCFSRIGKSANWSKSIIKYRQYRYTPVTDDAKHALLLIYKTIDIIKHYNPPLWVIENPIGRLRHIEAMQYFAPYRYCVNYADYGFFYSKETDLYTNTLLPYSTKKVQRFGNSVINIEDKKTRSFVPSDLVFEILELTKHVLT